MKKMPFGEQSQLGEVLSPKELKEISVQDFLGSCGCKLYKLSGEQIGLMVHSETQLTQRNCEAFCRRSCRKLPECSHYTTVFYSTGSETGSGSGPCSGSCSGSCTCSGSGSGSGSCPCAD